MLINNSITIHLLTCAVAKIDLIFNAKLIKFLIFLLFISSSSVYNFTAALSNFMILINIEI